MVGVAGCANAIGHLAETTINGIVSKARICGGFLGIRVGNPGELTVSEIAASFDLVLGVGNGGGASREIIGVVVLGIVCVSLAQEATADVVIPFGAISLAIAKM